MNRRRRAVITGLGVVAPNGIGRQAFWEALVAGKSGIDWISSFDPTPFPCKVAGEVRGFQPEDFMTRRHVKDLWRFTQFAVAAARMAVDDAKFELTAALATRVGACFGTTVNGFERVEPSLDLVREVGYSGLKQFTAFEYSTHAPASYVEIALGLKGPCMTLASGCSTGLDVLKWAHDQVSDGRAIAVVAGTTEAPLNRLLFATFAATGVLAGPVSSPSRASRPYDLTRDGIVLAEGAGALLVEDYEHAQARGAHIYAEIAGFGLTGEAYHLLKPEANGDALCRAIACALSEAHLSVADIDYVNSHGNSLPDYDAAETRAFKTAFGARAYSIPISSIKSMIGQPLAASGSLQAISTALTIRYGIIPPTINYHDPDPECDLDYVPNKARVARVRHALANAHSIGGTHSVLALRRVEE